MRKSAALISLLAFSLLLACEATLPATEPLKTQNVILVMNDGLR